MFRKVTTTKSFSALKLFLFTLHTAELAGILEGHLGTIRLIAPRSSRGEKKSFRGLFFQFDIMKMLFRSDNTICMNPKALSSWPWPLLPSSIQLSEQLIKSQKPIEKKLRTFNPKTKFSFLFLWRAKSVSVSEENELKSSMNDIVSPSIQKEITPTKGKAIDYRIDEVCMGERD